MNKEQFEKQYMKLYGKSIAWARRYGATDPEEIAQSAWVKAWAAIGTWRQEASFETWLFKIVYNEVMVWHRRSVRWSFLAEDYIDVKADVQAAALIDWMVGAVEKLPPVYREVLRLRLQGLDHDEISLRLQLGVPAIKSRIHRAVNILKEQSN